MQKIVMIRHFATLGNLEKRYIGSTDEPLSDEGQSILQKMVYPVVDMVYTSPLKRCVDTARLIYPDLSPILFEDLRECDFGDFENKNYIELSDNPDYQTWVDSQGTLPFPGGENLQNFTSRSVNAFHEVIKTSLQCKFKTIALVVHGGTIMSILDMFSSPHQDFYHWQVSNGKGFTMNFKKGRLINICGIL